METQTPLPQWAVTLKRLRKKQGESQKQFGERFGVTSQAVSSWECATYAAPARVFVWMMQELGTIDAGVTKWT